LRLNAESTIVVHGGGEMKLTWLVGLGLGLLALPVSAQERPTLKTDKDKVSYAVGLEFARSIKGQGIEVDSNLVVMGLKDALSGGKPLMSEEDLRTTMLAIQEEVKQKQMQAMTKAAEENKKAGDTFLAENAKKEGVVTLPSGLQYKILKAGEGKKPAESDTVACNYRGTFIDGAEFDSSYGTGKPANFGLKGVIPGFGEALKLMSVGSKWQIFVPSKLAYGERGANNVIGPNTALIFEIELVSIQDKP
jgi:UDP-GlcNAc:undecaprenyl-phosphate/decaprenyl-phosphate GlcNAc-1-phosphate transferase